MASGGFLFATTILLLLAVPSWGHEDCTQEAIVNCISDNTDPEVQCIIPGDAYRCLKKLMSTCSTDDLFHATIETSAKYMKFQLDKCPDVYEKHCFDHLVRDCVKPVSFQTFHSLKDGSLTTGECSYFNGSVTTMTNCFQDLKPKCDDSDYVYLMGVYLERLTDIKKECDF